MARTDELFSASLGILMPRITSTDFDEVMASSRHRTVAITAGPIPLKAGSLVTKQIAAYSHVRTAVLGYGL